MMEICKLSDIAKFTTGKLNSNAAETEGNYPFFTCAPEPLRINTYAFDTEAIILAGNNAEGNFHIQYYEGKFNAYQRTYVIESCDASRVNLRYLYYALKMCLHHFKQISQGTATKFLTAKILNGFELPIPTIEIQNKIASLLGDLDEKIESNEIINKNLSDILQAIYQKQFGEVSTGANQGILSDICSYSKEKVAVSELNVNTYFSTENMLPEKAGSTKATSLPATPQTTACRPGDTLISNIRPYFKKIVYCEDTCGCSTDVLCFTPVQSQYAAYLFSILYTDKFFAFIVAGSKGTKMPRGDKQQIMTYPVVLPAESELEEFNAIAFPVLEQLNSNKAENKRLSTLRDALLPKLMSGELDVSNLDL